MNSFNGHGPLLKVAIPKRARQPLKSDGFETADYEIHIPQATLDAAYATTHGLFLLQLLKAADYATTTSKRGVLLMGRKVAGGFKAYIRIPISVKSPT